MKTGDVLANARTPIGELALRPAVHAAFAATLGEAARAMKRNNVSAVLVDGRPPFKILTERDLVDALAAGRGAGDAVTDVASGHVVFAADNLPLGQAAALMVRRGIRHLPVTGADGRVIGVLGIETVFRVLLRESDLSGWVADFDGVLADGG